MTRRKFNLGEIIRKLNEDNPETSHDQHSPPPVETKQSIVTPPVNSPSINTAINDAQHESTAMLPEQPDLHRGRSGVSFSTLRPAPDKVAPPPIATKPSPPEQTETQVDRQSNEKPVLAQHYQQEPKTYKKNAPPLENTPPQKNVYIPPTVPSEDEEVEEEFDIFKYIGIVLRRKYIVIIVLIICTLLSLFRFLRSDTYYIANARLLFRPDDNQQILSDQRITRYWGDRENIFSTHLELLRSHTVLAMVAENMNHTVAPEEIGARLTIKQGETNGDKNDIIEISFRHKNSETARDVINEICRSYIEYRRDVNAQEVSRLVKKFEYQIDKLEKELDSRESDLRSFKESHRMVELSNETNLTISKLSQMEMALQATQLSILENNERLEALTTQISRQEQDIVQSVTYQDPFKNRISDLELELNTLTTEYSPEHFKVKNLRQQIDNLKAAVVDSLSKAAASKTLVKNPIRQALLQDLVNVTIEKSSLDAKRIAQEQLIDKLNQELIKLPAMQQKFANLQRETESLLQTLRMLKNKFEEAKIRRDSEESDLKILELAQTPRNAYSTSQPINIILGMLVGLILGIAVAFLIEYLDQSLKEPASVEKVLGLPLLGIVPFIEADHALLEQATDLTKNILEPFRALRANLKHIATNHHLQTFIICSAIKGEGKTTLGANLGITFALDGKKVILVDGDLRRSQVHTLFGVPKQHGLSDYLLGTANVDDIIKPTRINNMSTITSGERPNNPAELLGTKLFDHLIAELKEKADIIIFDSPALLPVSDTITMAPKMDGVLFVVRTFWTPLKAAKQALNQLERIGSRLYGGILNGASHGGKHYPYYYGYYGYYGYYSYKYSYDEDHKKPLTIRTAGLAIERKSKEMLTSFVYGIPKAVGAINREVAAITRKKRFWILLLLLLSMSGLRVYLKLKSSSVHPESIEYIGINASSPTDKLQPAAPENDIAFTGPGTTNTPAIAPALTYDTAELQKQIKGWYRALSDKNQKEYLSYYDRKSFRFSGGGIDQWEEQTEPLFTKGNSTVFNDLDTIRRINSEKNSIEVFIVFSITTINDTIPCTTALVWTLSNDGWQITQEKPIAGYLPEMKGE
jgi:polysaccharide biosynthesis transport protein